MLKLISSEVEVLNKDAETQMYPICDESGFTIGAAESYLHAMEIKKAVSNHNKMLSLLNEAKSALMNRNSRKSHKIQKEIESVLVAC